MGGLATLGSTRHLASDVWERRREPRHLYVRHFVRTRAHCRRDNWTPTVTGDGPASGIEFAFRWVDRPADRAFALARDEYLDLLE